MSIKTIEETFSCPDSPRLSLANIRGSVNIQAREAGRISVKARKHLTSGDEENTHIELSQSSDGTVKVSTRYNHKGFRFFRKWVPCKVDYEIRVPKDCALKVRGVSNSARIEGITGTHDISSVSGDVELHSLAGELMLKTVSGDAQGEMISGRVRLETVSGDIKIKKSDISKITGKTVSGDLFAETPLREGPYDFNSVSGDIKLYLPGVQGVTVTSSSIFGNIRNSLTSTQSNHSRRTHRIEIEGGGVEIHHSSVSGDIFLAGENNNGASPAEQALLSEAAPARSRAEILDQVNQGELSVDQAVDLLASDSG
jgi:hypothetical protein